MRRLVYLSLAFAALCAVPAAAQQPDSEAPAQAAPERQLPPAQRQLLESRLRERIAQVVKTQLQLTDDQMRQLQAVNARYEQQRRQLVQQEQYLRLSLRAQIALGDRADQNKVSGYIDQLAEIQQQRLEIFRHEQADLSHFMTPVQRAKYAALQEQLRRRIAQMRQRIIQQRQMRRQQRLQGRLQQRRPLRPRRQPY